MKKLLCSSVMLFLLGSIAQANLVTNGDFTTSMDDWVSSDPIVYWDGTNVNNSPDGPNVTLDNNVWFWQTGISLEEGQEYTVSFIATLLSNTSGSDVSLYHKIEKDGVDVVDPKIFAVVEGEWNEFSYTFTAPTTSDAYQLDFLSASHTLSSFPPNGTVSIGLDTISIVPEPATMALLGAGGLLAVIRRKK